MGRGIVGLQSLLAGAALALGAVALTACDATGDNAAISDKDAGAPGAAAPAAPAQPEAPAASAPGAAPAPAAATGPAPAAGAGLAAYVGKFPFDKIDGVTWSDHPMVKAGIRKSVTDAAARNAVLGWAGPTAPIALIDGKVSGWGCEQHNCGPHQWLVMVDPATGATDVCYFNESTSADHARWFLASGKQEDRKGDCNPE